MKIKKLLLFAFLISSFSAFSQPEESFPTMNFRGLVKTKVEYATATDEVRFSVRHARIGFRGDVAPLVSYNVYFELSNNGVLQVLDLTGIIRPTKNLNVLFGQFYIPILDPHITSPAQMMFANHPFAQHLVRNRDIGLMANYRFNTGSIPTQLDVGVFNANTINDPVWSSVDSLSLFARASFGTMTGFRTTVKVYNHPSAARGVHHFFYGVTARYEATNWRIDSEALWRDNRNNSDLNMFTTYIQAAYIHPIRSRLFHAVVPAVRWDTLTQQGSEGNGIDVNRFTAGLGFTLTNMPWARSSILRFDYELFVVNNRLDDFFRTPDADSNKFTVELVLNF
jgi:hypothetical protein